MRRKDVLKKPNPIPSNVAMKLFIAIMTCAALIFIIYIGRVPYGSLPQIGKVAERDAYAPLTFLTMPVSMSKYGKDEGVRGARRKDVYDIDAEVHEKAAQNVKNFFALSQSPKRKRKIRSF